MFPLVFPHGGEQEVYGTLLDQRTKTLLRKDGFSRMKFQGEDMILNRLIDFRKEYFLQARSNFQLHMRTLFASREIYNMLEHRICCPISLSSEIASVVHPLFWSFNS